MKIKTDKNSGEAVIEMGRRDERLLKAAATAPFQIKTILVPVDFSECSAKALKYAIPFAQQHGASITLVYVVGTPAYAANEYGSLEFARLEEDLKRNGEKELGALVKRETVPNVRMNSMVRCGAASDEIVKAANELSAELIIISTHGRTGLKHAFLGSVAEHVVRNAHCPVLVVREQEHEFLSE
jgi:universal stress protein A